MDESQMLRDQVFIVTGGSSGIGRAIALLASQRGAQVVVASRDGDACQAVVDEIVSSDGRGVAIATDVSQEPQVAHLVTATVEHFDRIDGLVNAAGAGLLALLEETTLDLWQLNLDVNLTGTFLCCRAVWAVMRRQGGGAILNVASSAVKEPHPGWSAYLAAKAGVVTLSETLAKEGYPHGIRVNVLLPSATASRMRGRNFPDDDPKSLLKPREVAEVALWFFAPGSDNVSGAHLEVRKRPRGVPVRGA
jgi:3-oxoacyl-[acyl-carrier protein] reductase